MLFLSFHDFPTDAPLITGIAIGNDIRFCKLYCYLHIVILSDVTVGLRSIVLFTSSFIFSNCFILYKNCYVQSYGYFNFFQNFNKL